MAEGGGASGSLCVCGWADVIEASIAKHHGTGCHTRNVAFGSVVTCTRTARRGDSRQAGAQHSKVDPRLPDHRLQAVLTALELREALGALTATWSRLGHEIGFGIAHGFATLGTIGFEGRFDYAAIGTVSNVASRLCDEAKPGQILITPRVLIKVENAVQVEPVGEFEFKGIRRPLAAYNVVAAVPSNV